MKKFGFATVLAGGLTAAVLGLAAPAGAAPTGPGNAQETINQLQADGYNVIVNRIGTTPLEQATVVAVRPGQTYSRTDSGTPGDSFENHGHRQDGLRRRQVDHPNARGTPTRGAPSSWKLKYASKTRPLIGTTGGIRMPRCQAMAEELTYDGTLREISTDAGVLRYHEAGDGPPLLFLHGSGPGVTGWRNFRGILATFAEHFRCLILEFPGFGVSDDFGGHPMVTAQGAVVTFVDALGLDSVDIIGNSMGGGVGINYAIRQPAKMRRLVTIGGIGTNIFTPGPSEGIRLLQEFTENPTRQRLVDWLHSMVYDPALVTEELIEERWALATDPATLESARRMYGKAAFATDDGSDAGIRRADALGDDAQGAGADAADLGPR